MNHIHRDAIALGSVAMQRQRRSRGVARRARWLVPVTALALAALWPRPALAAPPASSEPVAPAPEATSPAPRPQGGDYSLSLALAYTLAPLLAIPVGAGLFEVSHDDAVAVIGAGLTVLALPVTAHVLNGHGERGLVSAPLLLLTTFGGLVAGSLVGGFIGAAGCDDDSDCELANGMGGLITGGLLGGLAGYVGYAIYDVSANSSLEEPRLGQAGVRLWALPIVEGRRETQADATSPRVGGAMAGATLVF